MNITPKRTCTIPGCGSPHKSHGLCRKHLYRLKQGRDLYAPLQHDRKAIAAFYAETLHSDVIDECIIWPFSRNDSGYAYRSTKTPRGKTRILSRQMCIDAHGPPPFEGALAAHECGNGHLGCINPNHLSWKTHKQNSEDALRHGTVARGSAGGRSKLTEAQVAEILALLKKGEPQCHIAAQFNIAATVISKIHTGHIWTHVPREGASHAG